MIRHLCVIGALLTVVPITSAQQPSSSCASQARSTSTRSTARPSTCWASPAVVGPDTGIEVTRLARFGYAAKGVVYSIMGFLALRAAFLRARAAGALDEALLIKCYDSDSAKAQDKIQALSQKAEEKLGGGLSAWFQCESTADPRGQGQEGWCSRNSALGLKGGFGNLFIGNWDTPFKRTQAYDGDFHQNGYTELLLDGRSIVGLAPPVICRRGLVKTFQNVATFGESGSATRNPSRP